MSDFGRIITAMVTAFDANENLDLSKQTKLIEYLFQNETDSIIVNGTTGESPTLSKEEKIMLFEHAVEHTKGKGKVIAGTGTNNTKESIELTKKAEEIGVDGILLVNPYYNRPNQEGLFQHFKTIAESTSLPVMLYNIPGRSAVNMTPETVLRLAETPNITMVKESSGDLGQAVEILKHAPDNFLLYTGNDDLTLPTLSVGGYGVVSVTSHVKGNEMQEMIQSYLAGDIKKAAKLNQDLYDIFNVLFSSPSPGPVKRVLNHLGVEVGSTRLPIASLSAEEEKYILGFFN
ncbi:4-hydroxy-tetrahydrodipicolinate synthase [Bacillus horti]|uniref:4-hydroxy-tetrahydrodipicolinate synthase n=1 Tax=Caldalkalibacillus horti TaxID=77523 RepID=A0ABT9VUV7_9BACI|nr:4-hydroxy-tetrahydrodipicolinate synthase [Bacillus horti]MDQ0164772.1 4-hydroxy-tetrahydrodipicolinate synthase [Bacillus horti]